MLTMLDYAAGTLPSIAAHAALWSYVVNGCRIDLRVINNVVRRRMYINTGSLRIFSPDTTNIYLIHISELVDCVLSITLALRLT
jgi:hypothetical protein